MEMRRTLRWRCSGSSRSWSHVLLVAAVLFVLLALPATCRSTAEAGDVSGRTPKDNGDIMGSGAGDEHPTIFYQEDYVHEDYDPLKGLRRHNRPRKYKEVSRHRRVHRNDSEKYHIIKPESVYFDILPQSSEGGIEDTAAATATATATDATAFDASKMRVEIISLADGEEPPASKQLLLNKHPKKYGRRHRRDTSSNRRHRITKRQPHIAAWEDSRLLHPWSAYRGNLNALTRPLVPKRHPVKGNYWNPVSPTGPQFGPPSTEGPTMMVQSRFGGVNESDTVIWGSRPRDSGRTNADRQFGRVPAATTTTTTRPRTTAYMLPPLFHDADPELADTSFLNPPSTQGPPMRPVERSRTTQRPRTTSAPTRQSGAPASGSTGESLNISPCVWAILRCCQLGNTDYRQRCFEKNNCDGNFWTNPCNRDTFERSIAYAISQLD